MVRQRSNDFRLRPLLILAVGTFVLGVDGFVLPGLLPDVARDLSVSVATAGQLTTAFAVAYAIGSPIIATVTGRLDRRVVISVGMAVFLTGMVMQAAGPAYGVVLAGRILAALGAAAFQANAFAVAGELSPPERRARSFAVIGAGSSLASVLGVPFGLLIGQWIGWRGTMWTIAALAAVAAILSVTGVPSVMLPATTLRERAAVLVNVRILLLLLVSALILAPMYLISTYSATIVEVSTKADSAILAALFAFGAGLFTGNRLVGRIADRFGSLTTLASALAVTIVTDLILVATVQWFVPTLLTLFLVGFVGSFLFIPQQNRVFVAGGDVAAVALSLNGSMNYLGAAVGAGIGGVVLSTSGVFYLAPAAALLAAVVLALTGLTAPERRTRQAVTTEAEPSDKARA